MQAALGRVRPWARQLSAAEADALPQWARGGDSQRGTWVANFCASCLLIATLLGNILIVEETDAQRE